MHSFDLRWFVPVVNGILFGLLAMVLHEIGHVCVAQALGLKVKNVGFNLKGMYTVREAGPPEINFQVSLAGPLTNLALMALWPVSPVFGLANLFMGFCNLLPIPGSDGRRALNCLREMHAAPVENAKAFPEIAQRPFGAVEFHQNQSRRFPKASHSIRRSHQGAASMAGLEEDSNSGFALHARK